MVSASIGATNDVENLLQEIGIANRNAKKGRFVQFQALEALLRTSKCVFDIQQESAQSGIACRIGIPTM